VADHAEHRNAEQLRQPRGLELPPRARTSSIIVSTNAVGFPRAISSRTRPRPRRRVVASTTATIPSISVSPASRPASTFSTICSSGVSPTML
jgi:hypothetical protein